MFLSFAAQAKLPRQAADLCGRPFDFDKPAGVRNMLSLDEFGETGRGSAGEPASGGRLFCCSIFSAYRTMNCPG